MNASFWCFLIRERHRNRVTWTDTLESVPPYTCQRCEDTRRIISRLKWGRMVSFKWLHQSRLLRRHSERVKKIRWTSIHFFADRTTRPMPRCLIFYSFKYSLIKDISRFKECYRKVLSPYPLRFFSLVYSNSITFITYKLF